MIELSNIIMFFVFTGILLGIDCWAYGKHTAFRISNIIVDMIFSSIITIVWSIL